jgi:hypothetical protein
MRPLAFFTLLIQTRQQTFDLVDDYWLCLHPAGIVARQPACCLRRVLDPHSAWNQSSKGGVMTPASTRIDRNPRQPSVTRSRWCRRFGHRSRARSKSWRRQLTRSWVW